MHMFGRRAVPPLVLLLLIAGCSKPPPPETADVAGKVEDASGKPLAKVLVRFNGQEKAKKGLETISFLTKDDGSFGGPCPPGTYKVTLIPVPIQQGGAAGKGAPAEAPKAGSGNIPLKYTSPSETPWEVEVPPEGKKDFVFKVE
jgi:hypothetical protein